MKTAAELWADTIKKQPIDDLTIKRTCESIEELINKKTTGVRLAGLLSRAEAIILRQRKEIECTPAWKNGVQITAVANIGSKSGYNARKWKKWGKIPYVTYEEEIDMSNEELKALIRQTVKEVLDEENPVYKDLKDVPEYWKGAAAALLDSGAVNGGTPKEVCATDLNLRKETLKAAIVAVMYHEAREKA